MINCRVFRPLNINGFFLSWWVVETWSRLLEQTLEHKVRQFSEFCKCIKLWEVQSLNMWSRTRLVRKILSLVGSVLVWYIYKFLRAGCSACYVGETTRHFSTRVREHMLSDRTSHNFKHLQNSEHYHTLCSKDCFSILDHASSTFQLKIQEAIHIQWEKPTLNHQLYHVNLKLSL